MAGIPLRAGELYRMRAIPSHQIGKTIVHASAV